MTLARELLEFVTQNPPGDTRQVIHFLEAQFADLGLTTDQYVADPAKPKLSATLPGKDDRVLCFNGHVDTVPFNADEWTTDPLGEGDGDRLYGPECNRYKGSLTAILAAVRAYVGTDTTLPVTLQCIFVSDEGIGGETGLPAVPDAGRIDADACVIGEPTCEEGHHW